MPKRVPDAVHQEAQSFQRRSPGRALSRTYIWFQSYAYVPPQLGSLKQEGLSAILGQELGLCKEAKGIHFEGELGIRGQRHFEGDFGPEVAPIPGFRKDAVQFRGSQDRFQLQCQLEHSYKVTLTIPSHDTKSSMSGIIR